MQLRSRWPLALVASPGTAPAPIASDARSRQPDGAPPTGFVLTGPDGTRAVFDNPRHDFPQRIGYEVSAENGPGASIGFVNGGRPQRFEFEREGGRRP